MGEVTKLTRKIYTNSRMDLDFFMYLPTGMCSKDGSSVNINIQPVLYLRYKKNNKIAEEYDYMKASYKITPRNLFETIKFFNTMMEWLYSDKYNDLFLVGDNGDIVFNADYNKLSVKTQKGDFDDCIMQAIPTIVSFGEKRIEGVHLYVNSSKYCIPLTYIEISSLFGILKGFSFSEMVSESLTEFEYIQRNKAYMTTDWYSKKTPFD